MVGAQGVAPRLVGCRDAPRSLDHGRIFDAGNDLHLPATGFAGLYIDLEHALQTLRSCHCRVAVCRGLIRAHRVTPSASGRSHLLAQMMVGGEYAVITSQVDARVGHECRQPGDKVQWLDHKGCRIPL